MTSRRSFLKAIPACGGIAAVSSEALAAPNKENQLTAPNTEVIPLNGNWQFRRDLVTAPAKAVSSETSGWESISVPHTWQSLGRSPEYVGRAWYRTTIAAPDAWRDAFVRVEFEAVFHTAQVFLNGYAIGEHVGKGYTAFFVDLSQHLEYGVANTLLVRVDNTYFDTMLPRMKSYDWANDGGITRPVSLHVTPQVFVERLEIDAVPEIERKQAIITVRAVVRNTRSSTEKVQLAGKIRLENRAESAYSISPTTVGIAAGETLIVSMESFKMESPALWHFDAPNLYVAEVTLTTNQNCTRHTVADTFGIRQFEARGSSFYLNGEKVFLMGLERMAGSHPEFGMAEPTDWIEANHRDMKELNCVFTRVHWAQDKRVLEFCDRHGILMQEEVPAWGSFTFDKTSDDMQSKLEENGVDQLREMFVRDRNHPCLVSWGLCNEVDGKNPRTRAFAHKVADEARKLDKSRLLTYASHTLNEDPASDMAGDFDFISTNEYYGSWYPGGPQELRAHIDRIRKAFPGKPIVISEYGWCECQPSIPPGDESRVTVVNSHTEVLREFPEVAGAIYFDYNDYRTLVGDQGEGAFRQRVHGVVDLYANRKPSFDALRKQSSPIERASIDQTATGFQLRLTTRASLPAYTLRGYSIRWIAYGYDDLPMDGAMNLLSPLLPGTSNTAEAHFSAPGLRRIRADVVRPTGFSVATIHHTIDSN
jgi:beta-galactosidase